MKHRIFTTFGATPIKNIPTPIKQFNLATGEDENAEQEALVPATTYDVQEDNMDAALIMLNQIRVLLLILVLLKVGCLIFKK